MLQEFDDDDDDDDDDDIRARLLIGCSESNALSFILMSHNAKDIYKLFHFPVSS